MTQPILKVSGLRKRYCRNLKRSLLYGLEDIARECIGRDPRPQLRKNEFWANDGISFELRPGECLGLVGSNGAGKSTLLKQIAGLIKPDAGEIEINGRVGALIELGAGFNPLLSGYENIFVNGAVLGMGKREVAAKLDQILAFAELGPFIESPVQSYSSGMKVRLGFAVAAHLQPDLLLIDEVLAVGDVAFRMRCHRRIHQILKNTAVVFVSHNEVDVRRVSTKAIHLHAGQGSESSVDTAYQRYYAATHAGDPALLFTHAGQPLSQQTFPNQGAIDVQIRYRSSQPIPKARLLARIDSLDGCPLYGISSYRDKGHLPIAQGDNHFAIRLPLDLLMSGSYKLFLAIYGDDDQDFIFQSEHAATLHIAAETKNFYAKGVEGQVNLGIQWL